MRRNLLILAVVCAVGVVAAGKAGPDESVNFAKSWKGAVDEAKLLNVPIVVHSHGFN